MKQFSITVTAKAVCDVTLELEIEADTEAEANANALEEAKELTEDACRWNVDTFTDIQPDSLKVDESLTVEYDF